MRRLFVTALIWLLFLGHAPAQFAGRGAEIIGTLRGADFNSTLDQIVVVPPQVSSYILGYIEVTHCNATPSSSVGGFYTGAGKTGTILVAAAATYNTLTDSTVLRTLALTAAGAGNSFSGNVYFSLTTANGSPVQCDIYVIGYDIS